MKCEITNLQTLNTYKKRHVHKEVMDFGRWYRDKLNVEQKGKKTTALKAGVLKKGSDNTVNLVSCLNLFIEMRNKNYSWKKIKETLKDELIKKGLLTDEEYYNEFN